MNNSVAIGVVGTAKNTGKTTTLSYLLDRATRHSIPAAITGIGYDGEEIDNITMLPKPRINVPAGTILTTSEICLKRSPVGYRILHKTGMPTALGELLTVEVTKPGLVVIAGPNKVTSLRTVLDTMKDQRNMLILVDGSINRLMPMSVLDRIIFSTGASRSTEIPFLAEEMKAIEFLFRFPVTPKQISEERILLVRNDVITDRLPVRSVIDEEDVKLIESKLSDGDYRIIIPGLISKEVLRRIGQSGIGVSGRVEIVLSSPFPLLLSDNTIEIVSVIRSLTEKGIDLSYLRKPRLLGVTVNPFYPLYERERFSTAYIDKVRLTEEMKRNLSVPVCNVMEDTEDYLFNLCIAEGE